MSNYIFLSEEITIAGMTKKFSSRLRSGRFEIEIQLNSPCKRD